MRHGYLPLFFIFFITRLYSASVVHNTFEDVKTKGDVGLSASTINVKVTSKVLPHSELTFDYTSKIYPTDPNRYVKEPSTKKIEEGTTTFGIDYKGIENLTLQSHYYYDPSLYGILITQAQYYKQVCDDYLFTTGTQYFRSVKDGEQAFVDQAGEYGGIDFLALQTALEGERWGIDLNYSRNYGLSGIKNSYRGIASTFTSSMIGGGHGSYQPQTWMLKSRYTLPTSLLGKNELAMWLSSTRTNDDRGDEYDSYYLHLKHTIKNKTSVFLRYESMDYLSGKENVDYLKIFAGYVF